MDTELLLDRRDEQVGLKREVCLLQEELAESRAEREELESRNRALNDRLCQSVCPSVGLSLHVEAEQREWRRRVREGREREARQSLLIHRLQNKVCVSPGLTWSHLVSPGLTWSCPSGGGVQRTMSALGASASG
ncbi:hypothetical protein JOB18_045841 [Solea senegalensis]|uniref:Uncharacterized protein n=1 Tax=Solea senegalensis TaxID=28829 RepID=A0AAV6PHY6_SOLSE|nr:hypothetical protein JOB18_045841 [Solea senegalensis]